MFRFLYAVLYSLVLLSVTGIPTTVLAVSCNDFIPGTTYRYADALVFFTGHNGKTYAIAKSAATGGTSLPDGYFAFSADISQEYKVAGTDIASLKQMLSLGKYGAAKPVSIDSIETQDFIVKRFGTYLGSATSGQSTYIDAWKEFGAGVAFSTLAGTALSFNNLTSGGRSEYSGQAPQSVVIGSDGVWVSGQDGVRSSQIVEFPGTLDCALSPIDPNSITPPPQPPPVPPDPNSLSGRVCGQDLNGNGYTGELGEVANCIQTTQGEYCPVGSTDCVETYSATICPNGATLEKTRDMCQAPPQVTCGSGYSWDAGIDKCTKTIVCPENGTYNATTDRCEKIVQNDCSAGYTYDANPASPNYDRCVKPVSCTDGGVFVAARDRCEHAWMPVCDIANGYVHNAQSGKCERAPICSSGAYNTAYDLCIKPFNPACPSGYTFNATSDRCEMAPQCSQGTFNAITNKCESGRIISYSALCVQGTLNSVSGKCDIIVNAPIQLYANRGEYCYYDYNSPSCPDPGCSYYNSSDTGPYCADSTYGYSCPSGVVYPNICSAVERGCHFGAGSWGMSFGSSGGSGTITNNACGDPDEGVIKNAYIHYLCGGNIYTTYSGENRSVAISCPSNDFLWIDGYYYTSSTGMTTCPAGTTAQIDYLGWATQCTYTGATAARRDPTCPNGGTLQGTTCTNNTFVQVNPTCPSGSFDYGTHSCYAQVGKQCNDGFTLDSGTNICVKTPACLGGTLNAATNLCEAVITTDCGTYTLDAATNVCHSAPVCDNGAYAANLNVCLATLTKNCGSYSWSQADFKCLQGIVCPQDPAYSLTTTTTFSTSLDKCVSDAQHECPPGTAYTSLPINKCEAIPICSGEGIYNPQTDSCFEGLNTCPLGTQYACMEYQGRMRCSPNQCADATGDAVTDTMDESMLQDDARDANGNCLGQIYIFNGKASRCRPPGLTVGLLNDCCSSDDAMTEDTGNSLSATVTGIQTAYEIGQVAYYSSMVTSGAATLTPIVGTTSVGIVTASGGTAVVSGSVASGVSAAAASGTTGVAAVSSGLEAYAGALLNPATIAVAVVVLVAMKVLMGSGCDQGDIQTGMQDRAKDCHYVGDYCQKRYRFIGCVQKAKGYCCFNSKMARIIHEQGRPQLTTFQPNGDWGSPATPNCRGFSPDEFQALDFSRIDLSEYFSDIQKDLTNKIQGAQQKITDSINTKFQKVTQ